MKAKIILLIALLIVLLPIAVVFYPFIFNFGRTSANTKLLTADYSFLSRDEIKARLSTDFVLPQSVNLTFKDRTFPLDLTTISLKIDAENTASSLILRNLNQGFSSYFNQLLHPQAHELLLTLDEAALDTQLASISAQIDQPFVPTELQYGLGPSKNVFVAAKPGQMGLAVDRTTLKSDLIHQLSRFDTSTPLVIKANAVGNLPDSSAISATEARGSKIIGKSLTFTVEDKTVVADDKTLISWLGFNNNFDTDKIVAYVSSLSGSYKRDPTNAVFQYENGKVLQFKPAQYGLAVDETALVTAIPDKVNTLIDSSDKALTLTVPVKTTEPLVKTQEVNNLGIKELLGKGTSTFHHSDNIRNKNIEKGASVVNRILVAPGETFSFVKALGEVSKESGYYMAYVIRAGKTELDVGGGICQVSTTFFRAMLNSGLDITQRRNHAYRVSYYEEDMPPGYDATVFIPSPDLQFVNDTGNYLLIQNTFDLPNRTLTYEIYGTSDGRKAEISNYRQWDAAAAPPDVYIDDPSLPVGKVVQVEHRIPGLKTSFGWKVTRDGQTLHQKTFTSAYTPWAAVYRRGPTQ